METGVNLRLLVCALCTISALGHAKQAGMPAPAIPLEPIGAIVDAFRAHPIVMLGHPHGNEQKYAFQLSLIRDPRFAAIATDIVEECGNSKYQDVMDRFVRGEEVPYSELRQAWENTISGNTNCDLPMYEGFFRAVRDVNAALPPERKLRVLLGDVPIDWANVRTFADIEKWEADRSSHTTGVIQREVLAKGRRALVLYGEMHAQRKDERFNYESADRIAARLERDGATKVFNIWPAMGMGKPDLSTLQADVARWKVPSLATTRGTVFGAADFLAYYTPDFRVTIRDGKPARLTPETWARMRMEDQFNAVLYLGPTSAMTFQRLSRDRCAEASYMAMRTQRMALLPGGQSQVDRLKKYCAG